MNLLSVDVNSNTDACGFQEVYRTNWLSHENDNILIAGSLKDFKAH